MTTSYGATTLQTKNRMEALGYTNRGTVIDSGEYKWTSKDVLLFAIRHLTDDDINKLKKFFKTSSDKKAKKKAVELLNDYCKKVRHEFSDLGAHIYRYGVYSLISEVVVPRRYTRNKALGGLIKPV